MSSVVNRSGAVVHLYAKEVDEHEIYNIIGKNIKRLRKTKSLTQLQIAKLLSVSPQQVQKYEAGTSAMYVHTLIKLGKILEIEITELVLKEEELQQKEVGSLTYYRDKELHKSEKYGE